MVTVLDEIISILKGDNYIVNVTLQEKQLLASKEVVIVAVEMDVRVETTVSYRTEPVYALRWQEQSTAAISPAIVKIMKLIEKNMTVNKSVKFRKPKIETLGIVYMVELPFSYIEVVRTDT